MRAAEHDSSVRAALALDVDAIQSGFAALLLRARCALLREPPVAAADGERDTGRSLEQLAASIDLVPTWAAEAGARSVLLTDSTLPLAKGSALDAWVDERAAECLLEAVRDDDAASGPDAGVVYEALLELRVRRVDAETLCLKPNRTWISTRDVLAEPPRTRGKWVTARASLPKSAALELGPALAAAETADQVTHALRDFRARASTESVLAVESAVDRRRSGSHFTPRALCRAVIERALAPLLPPTMTSDELLRLRVCDPSMGSGAFLSEAADVLADRLLVCWRSEERPSRADDDAKRGAVRAVVTTCLYGVDKDPVAVDLARCSLAGRCAGAGEPLPDLSLRLVCGDALLGGATRSDDAMRTLLFGHSDENRNGFDWWRAFPDVFDVREAGFDACIGNPPWVAYAGRAAQPLDPALAQFYLATNPAFAGYRTLHGLFVRKAVELLRPGGRLGFVLPTSVADLAGYRPARRAHDALAEADRALYDFGDGAFSGVFQPCMALTSTKRRGAIEPVGDVEWELARSDLDAAGARLLARLSALPKLDPALFGERGFQTTGRDLAHIRHLDGPEPPFVEPIREGVDISEFQTNAPRCFLDPVGLSGRFRPRSDWASVGVLIRQTARYPIAALADGVAFRNSILAGFSNEEWTPPALAAYLNSSGVRYYHFVRHRDARQGMPQLKIGHLRALPAIASSEARTALGALGRRVSARNGGLTSDERSELERIVFDAWDLQAEEREIVLRWAEAHPLPKRRERGAGRVNGKREA